jgi:type I restriction enzyme M protein
MANNNGKDKSLESWIWDAACSIRGAKDAPKYKDYILPLIFTKRLCDVFDDELNRIAKEVGSRKKAFQLAKADHKLVRFYLPLVPVDTEQPVWSVIRKLSDKIGEGVTTHMRAIARENPLLQGIIDLVDFNATTHGQRDLDDDRLSNLIEAISTKRLGLDDVEADIIGKSYEYLIRKFAEGGGQSAGEFYTPPEVGTIMSRVLQPEPGMEIYDPTCGSGGLLVKCEIEKERGFSNPRNSPKSTGRNASAPLKLFGQENTPETWAMANMNMIIHDMARSKSATPSRIPNSATSRASCAASTASSPIPCGTRTGSPRPTTTTTNSTASPPVPAFPANPPPTGAGCSTSTPA